MAAFDRLKNDLAASEELRASRLARLTTQSEAHRGLFRTFAAGNAGTPNVSTASIATVAAAAAAVPTVSNMGAASSGHSHSASAFAATSAAASSLALETVAALDEQERAEHLWKMQQRGGVALLRLLNAQSMDLVGSPKARLPGQSPPGASRSPDAVHDEDSMNDEEASVLANFDVDHEAVLARRFGVSPTPSSASSAVSLHSASHGDDDDDAYQHSAEGVALASHRARGGRVAAAPQIAAAMAAAQRRLDGPSRSPEAISSGAESSGVSRIQAAPAVRAALLAKADSLHGGLSTSASGVLTRNSFHTLDRSGSSSSIGGARGVVRANSFTSGDAQSKANSVLSASLSAIPAPHSVLSPPPTHPLDRVARQVQRSIELELKKEESAVAAIASSTHHFAHNELVHTQQQLLQSHIQPRLQVLYMAFL